MRKIEKDSVQAFYDMREFKRDNSRVTVDTNDAGRSKVVSYLLHGNLIAQIVLDKRDFYDLFIEDGGWQTVTTKSRLNAILGNKGSVYQHKHVWYYVDTNGKHHSFDNSPYAHTFNNRTAFYVGRFYI